MAQIIQFTPRTTSLSGLLRAARQRSGLTSQQFASRLGELIGRPQLSPGTVRAWETGTTAPPLEIIEAAQQLAREAAKATELDGLPAASPLIESLRRPEAAMGQTTVEAVMQAFRDADRQVGGGYVYGAVIRYLEHEVAPQLFTGTRDVFAAAAALTEMAGWMAHDAGEDAIAHQHFHRAMRFASGT